MKGIGARFFPLFSAALVFLCAGLVGCASGGASGVLPPAQSPPEFTGSSEIRLLPEAQRRQVASALNTPELGSALGPQATNAPIGVSHDPRILNTNPFPAAAAAPPAPVSDSAPTPTPTPSARAANPADTGYKAFEIAFPEGRPLMTIAIWIADDPEFPDPNKILLRLQVHIAPESFASLQDGKLVAPADQVIPIAISPPQPEPPPEPFDPAKCDPANAVEGEHSPSTLAWDLAAAISSSDLLKSCELVRLGAKLEGTGYVGASALHDVIVLGTDGDWLEMAKMLILNGADPNHADSGGRGPLHWAARRNAVDLISLLLANGANLHLRAAGGHSPLDDAAEGGRRAPAAAKLLRDSGGVCHVNTASPLCEGAHPPEFLAGPQCPAGTLDSGGKPTADLNMQLRLAARAGETEKVCEYLRRGADIDNTLDGAEESVVHEAARGGHLAAVNLLLANGAKVNQRKEGAGASPLDIASRNDNSEIATALRAVGGQCFLESGPLCQNPPVVVIPEEPEEPEKPEQPEEPEQPEIPVSADLCPSSPLPAQGRSQDRLGRELFLAVMRVNDNNWGEEKRTEICNWLRRGADINYHVRLNELTALHIAPVGVDGGVYDAELAEFLMANGADPNARNGENDTPMHIAARAGRDEVLKALAARGGNVAATGRNGSIPLHAAVIWKTDKAMEVLIELGSDVNAQNNRARAPLHIAAYQGRVSAAETLLNNGAEINAQGEQGQTPLHYTVNNRGVYPAMVEMLLARGANFGVENNDGRTPLEWASYNYWHGERNQYVLEVFTYLRKRVALLQQVMEILRAAEAAAPSTAAARADANDGAAALAGRFASAFSAGPAFGDMFGAADGGASFTSRLNSLMRAESGATAGRVDADGGAWFSAGARGDAGFGVAGDSPWGGAGLAASPYAALAGYGLQAGGETAFHGGAGRLRFAAFGDFERGELTQGFGGWALRGAGAGADALQAAEGLSAFAGGRMRSGGALAEIHQSGGLGEAAFQAGILSESGSFLSGISRGADLPGLRARTAFAGFGGMADLGGGWRLRGSAHLGRSWGASDGILRRGEAWSSAFAAGVERGDWLFSGDNFILRLSQPLRVERWEMDLAEGGASVRAAGSAPSGRQLDIDAAYRMPLTGGGRMLLSAGMRGGRGHAQDSGVEGAAIFSLEREF